MTVRVLVVDDSGFFRHRIAEFLASDKRLEVAGFACNGLEAVQQNQKLKPDLITMDIEMPVMDGIEAVKEVMRTRPAVILMLSSLTQQGATTTLRAIDAGASDYMPKDMREWLSNKAQMQTLFCEKVFALSSTKRMLNRNSVDDLQVRRNQVSRPQIKEKTEAQEGRRPHLPFKPRREDQTLVKSYSRAKKPVALPTSCQLLVIGASTGGPAALQKLLTALPAKFPCPILLVQHMPKSFTQVFAARLNQQCKIQVKEAEDGDIIKAGCAYLAPGGCQMTLNSRNSCSLHVTLGDQKTTFKPSVDVTYSSAAKEYGKSVLAVILTGMGSDGAQGASLLKQSNAKVWAQDQESSTIFGMPKSVIEANCADQVLSLDEMVQILSANGTGGR